MLEKQQESGENLKVKKQMAKIIAESVTQVKRTCY